jgi:alkylation response protein AidB-like acyl-CoA dehydrogenase
MMATPHPFNPGEAISREQAVRAYTWGSAYAEFAEREKGALAAGMLVDLAVLSPDIFTVRGTCTIHIFAERTVSDPVFNSRDVAFQLYEVLDTESLTQRPRFAEHSREMFDAVLDTARGIADTHLGNHRKKNDAEEPRVVDGKVVMIPEVKAGLMAIADAGFISSGHDAEIGGMQLPHSVTGAALAYFDGANCATTSYAGLTAGAANLIEAFGTQHQKDIFLPPMFAGRFTGTMALTEPDAGSSLSDIRTTATSAENGVYHITGTKIWISGGDHELSENIVHMVLARIKGAPEGTKGISLFIVTKKRVGLDGSSGDLNNVTLAGIIHKMGWRGTTSALLNFGEHGPCVGYLIGEPNKGLSYMFQMMNDARIAVGRSAMAMGYAAYLYSLDYAKTRRQGRIPGEKDPLRPPVTIIEHADVRRMLLQQKAACEGSLALILLCARLMDDEETGATEEDRQRAMLLLEMLTPIAKAWPSASCQEGISNAVQVLGGYGYAREYSVEQYYRDNRLNQIHEGTNGIQALDLLGRKVTQEKGAAFAALVALMSATVADTPPELAALGTALEAAIARLSITTRTIVGAMMKDPARGLANATAYLDLTSRTVYAWLWLRQATVAQRALAKGGSVDAAFYQGKVQTARYYFAHELPKTVADAALLDGVDTTAFDMAHDWF